MSEVKMDIKPNSHRYKAEQQAKLSEERKAGLSKMTISRYLNKKRMPTLKALVNLSYVLCVPITDLIPTYAMID